jgi:23S rRNA (guanosine2251-2'-O)-methyltransferase
MADRTASEATLLPGRKPVLEALGADPRKVDIVLLQKGARGRELDEIVDICRLEKVRFRFVPRSEIDRLYAGIHQGVLARVTARSFIGVEDLLQEAGQAPLPLILALDQVQDPGNAGAMARTLHALGGAGLLVPRDRTAFLGPAAAKASAGALERLPVARVTNLARALDFCAEAGLLIYGSAAGPGSESLFTARLALPAVLVMGGEERGIRPNVARRCTRMLGIPLARGADSLNVAAAAAVLVSRFWEERLKAVSS